MSALSETSRTLSPEEYLAGEALAEVRHEFVGGRVYAMAGASEDHNRITGNLFASLWTHLDGHPCEVFATDLKARPGSQVFYYPDVMVCCDPTDTGRPYRERPRYVFEVISPDTRSTDEREKSVSYFHMPSVEAYVLIEQHERKVRLWRRGENWWDETVLTAPDDELQLPDLGFALRLDRLYARTAAQTSGADQV